MMQVEGNTSEGYDGNLRRSLQERCESLKVNHQSVESLGRLIRKNVPAGMLEIFKALII
jgi:hypothetical protein